MADWSLEELIKEVIRMPGLRVDRTRLDPSYDAEIAKRANRYVVYDSYGNPVFMPNGDPEGVQKLHEIWTRIDAPEED
jgi:hypothetical protein